MFLVCYLCYLFAALDDALLLLTSHIFYSSCFLLFFFSFFQCRYGLTSISLSFFLCAFQVHEKSILFPVATSSIVVLEEPKVIVLFIATATFSMYPLLSRDGLVVPYVVTLLTFVFFAWNIAPVAPFEQSRGGGGGGGGGGTTTVVELSSGPWFQMYAMCSVMCMLVLHALPLLVAPPARYPDLFVLLLCAYCCAQFLLAWAYSTWRVWCMMRKKTTPSENNNLHNTKIVDCDNIPLIPPFKKKNQ